MHFLNPVPEFPQATDEVCEKSIASFQASVFPAPDDFRWIIQPADGNSPISNIIILSGNVTTTSHSITVTGTGMEMDFASNGLGYYSIVGVPIFDGCDGMADEAYFRVVDCGGGGFFPRMIQEDDPQNYELETFPNPVQGQLNLKFALPKKGKINVALSDIQGKHLSWIEQEGFRKSGNHLLQIDMKSIPPGVYLLHFKVGDYKQVKKVIKH